MSGPTPAEQDERRVAFNDWLRNNGDKLGFYTIQPNRQQHTHEMLRKAFNAGFNFRSRKSV